MTIARVLAVSILVASAAMTQNRQAVAGDEPSDQSAVSSAGVAIGDGASLGDLAADFSVQALAGFSASSNLGPEAEFDYNSVNLRGGLVLLPDHQSAFLPTGDVTCLLDFIFAHPQDFGSLITGPSVLLRKDLRPSTASLIPYAQAGGGMVYTDADNVPSQRVIGRSWEFLLQAGLGCHCRIARQWTFDVEGSYQHISNARLASRNLGSNNFGVVVGFTHTWGP